MRGTHPQRRVAKQHAIIRLDVMRPIPTTVSTLVLLALAAAGQTLGIERAGAQTPPAAAKTAKTKAAAKPAQAPAPEAAPAPVQQPVAVTQSMAEEAGFNAGWPSATPRPTPHNRRKSVDQRRDRRRRTLAPVDGGKLAEAKTIRDRIGDPAARKLVDWFVYRGGYGTASEIRAFLDNNPAWPSAACSPSARRRRCSTAPPVP
jgi:hypothetical protein